MFLEPTRCERSVTTMTPELRSRISEELYRLFAVRLWQDVENERSTAEIAKANESSLVFSWLQEDVLVVSFIIMHPPRSLPTSS